VQVATKAYLRGGKDGFESLKASRVLVDGETNPRLATLVQYLWMRVEHLNETLAEEWQRMVQHEQRRAAGQASESDADAAAGHTNGAAHGSSSSRGATAGQGQGVPVAAGSGSAEAAAASASAAVTYSPGSPISGVATGLPGSIPHAAEQHVHEVSSTGAAISLALLLEQRRGLAADMSAAAAAASDDEGGSRQAGGWASLLNEEQQACSSAALSALAYLEPCAHGLDELIVFDPIKRKVRAVLRCAVLPGWRSWMPSAGCACLPGQGLDPLHRHTQPRSLQFGIAPRVEGRIRCVSQHAGGA
jgi:hypothetical protein